MKFHAAISGDEALRLPMMLGHFLPWYTVHSSDFPLYQDDASTLDWQPEIEEMRHWRDGRSEYRRTHLHLPEIGVYDSRDPSVIEWQIRAALEHGVSGFIVNWYGKYSVENIITLHWLRGLERWNAGHPDQPFLYCISYDAQAQWASEGKRPVSAEEDFDYIRAHLLRDAYLHRDGRPIFTVFPYGDQRAEIRVALDHVFGKDGADLVWSGEPTGQGEDACYHWVRPDEPGAAFWNDPDNCGEGYLRQVYKKVNHPDSSAAYVMHGVWPEFNNQLVAWGWQKDPSDPGIRPCVICRETTGGNTLDRTWRVYLEYLARWADGSQEARVPAPLIQLVTWNDYAETSSLEPSKDHGRVPLEACRTALDMAREIWQRKTD